MLDSLPVLQKIADLKVPMKKAYQIYSLIKGIEEKRYFYIEEEKKLINSYNAEVLDNGRIKFQSAEDQIKFSHEQSAMLNCELDDIPAIELSFDDLNEATFTAKELMSLEGVINLVD